MTQYYLGTFVHEEEMYFKVSFYVLVHFIMPCLSTVSKVEEHSY